MPLDRKSLQVVSEMFSRIGMAKSFSMGDIENAQQYRYWQLLARVACAAGGGSPLLLDVFALNNPDCQSLYTNKRKKKFFAKVAVAGRA